VPTKGVYFAHDDAMDPFHFVAKELLAQGYRKDAHRQVPDPGVWTTSRKGADTG
jgi:hypothetical protein